MNSVTISWKLRLFMKVFNFFGCKIIMSLNTVGPTNYHEFEYSKISVFKLKFTTTCRIHASRWTLLDRTDRNAIVSTNTALRGVNFVIPSNLQTKEIHPYT